MSYSDKDYLGDSVYVEFDGYNLLLYTDNGNGPVEIIVLEPAVFRALLAYHEKLKAKYSPGERQEQ